MPYVIGEKPVHRLEQPGDERDREESSSLAGTEVQRLFQQKGEREVDRYHMPWAK
jgi:hypothetical protein